jgi:hypothetical protein
MARRSKPSSHAIAVAQQAQVSQQGRSSSALLQLLHNRERRLKKRDTKLADEVYYRLGIGHGALILHEFATQGLHQAHMRAQEGYTQTVRQLNAAKRAAYLDPETAEDLAEWTTAQKLMVERHYAASLEGVATQLIRLTGDPLYREEEEEAHGFLARLFGGGQ